MFWDFTGTQHRMSDLLGGIIGLLPILAVPLGVFAVLWTLEVWPPIALRFTRCLFSRRWRLEALTHEIAQVWEKKAWASGEASSVDIQGFPGPLHKEFPSLAKEREIKGKLRGLGVRTANLKTPKDWDRLVEAAQNRDLDEARRI